MRIAMTGSTGLIGTALVAALSAQGHAVTRLVRDRAGAGVYWDPARGEIDAAGLERCDAVIHLAGASVAGRWTAAHKRRIRESRVVGTALLARALAALMWPPRVLLSGSAIGYYGDRDPADALDESAAPGTGFLAGVVQAWEQAARPARDAGIRVVHLRSANVLSSRGGYLGPLLPLFRLGLGGWFGSGRQILSWIARDEYPRVVAHLLAHDEVTGPVNVSAPNPVTHREFARTLARVLRRPALVPMPAPALRLVLGEFAGEVLGGARVVPGALRASGYVFRYPDLEGALRHELSR